MAAAGTELMTAAAAAVGIPASVVLLTTKISLAVQIATGLIGLQGLTYALPPPHAVLRQLLAMETAVQFVELTFYAWFVYRFNLAEMAATRYADWFFTTPTMLLTTIIYFRYRAVLHAEATTTAKDPPQSVFTTIADFLRDNKKDVAIVLSANAFMLVIGFLGEIGAIPMLLSALLGFAGLGVSFATVYEKFAKDSPVGRTMFAFLATFWSAYGVAFLFPTAAKNIAFNVLDVFAKNFFGIYLYFQVRRIAAETRAAPPNDPRPIVPAGANLKDVAESAAPLA